MSRFLPNLLRRWSGLALCSLAAVLAGGAAGRMAAADAAPAIIRVGLERNSEPFTFVGASGQNTGFAYELLREVLADQKISAEYVMLPWNDLLNEFKAGHLDVICNLVDSPERRAYIDFSATTILLRGAAYARNDVPALRTTADLKGRRIATVLNSRSHEYLRGKDWGVQFVLFDSLALCVDAVHEGRADLFVATQMVSDYQIRQRGYKDLVPVPLVVPDFDYREHFGVQPGRADLLARLNDGLLTVQRNGTYDRLYEKWIGPIVPRTLRWRDIQNYVLPLVSLLVVVLAGLGWQRRVLGRVKDQAAALQRSEEQLSLVLDGSQDGFWDWDLRAGTIVRSPRWAGMLGFSLEEIEASRQGFLDRIHPEDRARVEANERAIWTGTDRFFAEFRMQAKDGSWVWILDRGKVVERHPLTSEPWRVAGTHTDITERKRTEQENVKLNLKMLETQKLESLGVLAGGIAHDFNNLLTVILGNASLSQAETDVKEAERARLATIATAARQAADLCRQLLAYAGKGAFIIERLDLNRVTEETGRLLELSVHTCRLEFDLAPDLPAIEADPSQIQQTIMNLVLNAAEAIEVRPGRIQISTKLVELRAGDVPDALPAGAHPVGSFVRLEISDSGAGMTPEVLKRIFDPFYTTKFAGRGLGLAAVLGIVRSHGGALTAQSKAGQGSVFRLYLPAAAGEPAAAATKSAPPIPGGSGTLLVADDEHFVRRFLSEVLRRAGYEVIAVESGDAALRRFTAEPDRFLVALLDITMPGMDGLTTLRKMRELRPALPCVILSGHSEQDAGGPFGGTGATTFLQKPFEMFALTEALDRVKPAAPPS